MGIAYATIRGDMTVCQATSQELSKFGIPAGYKNYAAAYCTGLLLARRVLKKFGLDDTFKGVETHDGAEYHVEDCCRGAYVGCTYPTAQRISQDIRHPRRRVQTGSMRLKFTKTAFLVA